MRLCWLNAQQTTHQFTAILTRHEEICHTFVQTLETVQVEKSAAQIPEGLGLTEKPNTMEQHNTVVIAP